MLLEPAVGCWLAPALPQGTEASGSRTGGVLLCLSHTTAGSGVPETVTRGSQALGRPGAAGSCRRAENGIGGMQVVSSPGPDRSEGL